MKTDATLFGRRIRQNHALEHATITILSGYVPNLRISARSSSRGFIIFGDVDLGQLRRALDEALRRLQAGEAELAIHPNCGTNVVVGVSLLTFGTLLGMTSPRAHTPRCAPGRRHGYVVPDRLFLPDYHSNITAPGAPRRLVGPYAPGSTCASSQQPQLHRVGAGDAESAPDGSPRRWSRQ